MSLPPRVAYCRMPFLAALAVPLLAIRPAWPQVLPEPTRDKVFYIAPLCEGTISEEETRREMDRLIAQFGRGNLYNQIGLGGISSTPLRYAVAEEKRLRIVPIFASGQTHNVSKVIREFLAGDLRAIQWRMDGRTWKGAPKSAGGPVLETNPDPRDNRVPTPSRYCLGLRAAYRLNMEKPIAALLAAWHDHPRQLAAVNGVIEEELAIGGTSGDAYLGDWSPYAITEFRDWLRHTGLYDADTGTYSGQGAPEALVGGWQTIRGKRRSTFYDDPSPESATGPGPAFNAAFGTAFRTWTVKYWDLRAFPEPITDTAFDPTPESGRGFTAGGFDAPRAVAPADPFWKAWSWDYEDQGKAFPPGDPLAPAYGFRQQLVKHWIRDMFDHVASKGIPRDLMYAHQIPGEMVSRFTGGSSRGRSSASPTWTGYLEGSGTVGVTRFGRLDIPMVTRYQGRWGIFEWHPAPNSAANSQSLYASAMADLKDYKAAGARLLCPGWWRIGRVDSTFPLNDSRFAEAIRDFLAAQPERPRGDTLNDPAAFVPPPVRELQVQDAGAAGIRLRFSPLIWRDQDFLWTDWGQFKSHQIEWSPDSAAWTRITAQGDTALLPPLQGQAYLYFRVRAVSKAGKGGEWAGFTLCASPAQAAREGKACGGATGMRAAPGRWAQAASRDARDIREGSPRLNRAGNAYDAKGALLPTRRKVP